MKNILKTIFVLGVIVILVNTTKTKTKTKQRFKNNLHFKQVNTSCDILCETCSSNDQNTCLICVKDAYLHKGKCVRKCPSKTYVDKEWQECRQCDPSCPQCWGPSSQMCGTVPGVRGEMVYLQNEIKKYLEKSILTCKEVNNMLTSLRIILQNTPNKSEITTFLSEDTFKENNSESLDIKEVYETNNSPLELPIASFSKDNGVYIGVPAHINSKFETVASHWIFIKGSWNGQSWTKEWFPNIPTFIKKNGNKEKIYIENNGYWIHDTNNGWFYQKGTTTLEPALDVNSTLGHLNTIAIESEYYKVYKKIDSSAHDRIVIQRNINAYFDLFKKKNDILFSELEEKIRNEESDSITSLEGLKMKIKNFLDEEDFSLKLNK